MGREDYDVTPSRALGELAHASMLATLLISARIRPISTRRPLDAFVGRGAKRALIKLADLYRHTTRPRAPNANSTGRRSSDALMPARSARRQA